MASRGPAHRSLVLTSGTINFDDDAGAQGCPMWLTDLSVGRAHYVREEDGDGAFGKLLGHGG